VGRSRLTALALAPALAFAVGCGGSDGSSSGGADTTASTPAPKAATGPKVTAPDFTAVLPDGFKDATSAAKPNATTGALPELQLTGSRMSGIKAVIRVAQLSAHSTAPFKGVANATVSSAQTKGDQVTSGPDASTIGGDDAFTIVTSTLANGKSARSEYVLIRHNSADYTIVFVASPKGYDAGQPALRSFISSLRFR
jgi:hypothetical protein